MPADGGTVAGLMLDHLRALNAGAVAAGLLRCRRRRHHRRAPTEDLDINGPLLAPGYGAQGGTAADLRRIFGPAYPNVLPSSSREVLRAGPDVGALRAAAERANDELRG